MDMYARMMDDLKQSPDDNPTVGIRRVLLSCGRKKLLISAYRPAKEFAEVSEVLGW